MEVQQEESPIYGDLLEVILAHVPLIDLVCAYRVSKTWECAVWSSLRHMNAIKPWFMIHTQCARSLTQKTIQAYDPRSKIWIEINQQPSSIITEHISHLQTTNSNLLYKISPQRLSLSIDPLHLTWVHIAPPKAWRVDPIVAQVGPHIVVAGGASEYLGDNPLLVEMYDMETSKWSTCQPMPDILKQSAASTWLSVAANQNKMYVTQKASAMTYSFDPKTKTWSGPYDLRLDSRVFLSAIGFAGEDLILAGVLGHSENVNTLKIWKINLEKMKFDQIGEIPSHLLEKLKGENPVFSSISLTAAENFIYLYNSSDPAEIIYCEIVNGDLKWESVKNLAWNDEVKIGEKMVMSCARIGISDLHRAMKSGTYKFSVKSNLMGS